LAYPTQLDISWKEGKKRKDWVSEKKYERRKNRANRGMITATGGKDHRPKRRFTIFAMFAGRSNIERIRVEKKISRRT